MAMMDSVHEINIFIRYFKKALMAMFFVFFLPIFYLFGMIKYGLEFLKIDIVSVNAILPFLPFAAFLFVVVFLFNGAFWMGFFSENPSLKNTSSLTQDHIKLKKE